MSHNDNFEPPGTPGMPHDDHFGYDQGSIESEAAILTNNIESMPESSPILDTPQSNKGGLFIKIAIGAGVLVLAASAVLMNMVPEKPKMKPVTSAPAPVDTASAPMAIPGMQAMPSAIQDPPKAEEAAPIITPATPPAVPMPSEPIPAVPMPSEPAAVVAAPQSSPAAQSTPNVDVAPIPATVVESEKSVSETEKKSASEAGKINCDSDVKADKPVKTDKPPVKKTIVKKSKVQDSSGHASPTDSQWKKIF